MFSRIHYSIMAVSLGLLLSACQSPDTPQQVAQHFWQAVIEDRPDAAAEYSTLQNAGNYDRFSLNWSGFQPSFGKIIIDNDRSTVESTFLPPAGQEEKARKLTTYLVLQAEEWKVDYQKTGEALIPKKAANLGERLNRLGKTLSEQLDNSADELNTELEQLGDKLEDLTDRIGDEAARGLESFSIELEKSLEELEKSIDRALKDRRKQQPEQGEGDLQET